MRPILPLIACAAVALFLAGCSRYPSHRSQGYVEGRYTYMATSVSGRLEKLLVQRGSKVKMGQMLFILESQPEMDAYLVALGKEEQAIIEQYVIKPNLVYARQTYNRYKALLPKNAIQQSQLDSATANYESLQQQLDKAGAAVATANAASAQAQWNREQKIVSAPVDAIVFDTYYRLGEYTEAGKPILSLLAPADIKVIFYVNEKNLGAVQIGDPIEVRCSSCEKHIGGKISFISPSAEYTPPVIFSDQTNEKLIYRVEAEFNPDIAYKLHPGQPVTVTYHSHV